MMDRGLIAGRDIWFYLGKLAWPHPLIFIYPRWEVSGAVWWQYLFPAAALLLAAGLWRWRGRLGVAPLVALLFFAGTLFPALGFFDVYPFRYSFVADHFQYLAGIGPLALAGAGVTMALDSLKKTNRWLKPALGGALLLILGVLTWRQCGMYVNVETLWRTTLAENPACWMAHNNLGSVLQQTGRLQEAVEQYEAAISLDPDGAEEHNNLGDVLYQTGRVAEAMEQYEQALQIKPDYASAQNNLGEALFQTGRVPEAMEHFEEALRLNPNEASAHVNLGNAFIQSGLLPEALEQFEQALKINPSDAAAHYDLGSILLQTGRFSEATQQYEEALRIKPDFVQAQAVLARLKP
jgi:tetratricopeptide (TPR) repeat protein